MAALLGSWRVIQDYAVMPRILGHELEIHPLGAIFAVLVGAELGGVVGIFLAVPLAAARVVWRMGAGERPQQNHHRDLEVSAEAPPILAERVTN